MNKRMYFIIVVVSIIGLITGCSNNATENIEKQPVQVNENNLSSGNVVNENVNSANVKVDYAELGFKLVEEEKSYILSGAETIEDVVEILGEPEEKLEASVSWVDGLEHQMWLYKKLGIDIDVIKNDDDSRTVYTMKLSDPCNLKTSKGIFIGSSKNDVIKAYKDGINTEENDQNPDSIVVGTVYGGLIFSIEDNQVVSIFLGAAAE